jgi:hypothetical protein
MNYIRPEFDIEIQEILNGFLTHKAQLLKYLDDKQQLMIDNILDFKDHATSVIGDDLTEFFDYLINKYSLSKLSITNNNQFRIY